MGTPSFAVEALEALVKAGHNVVCVYSQPPKPAGRGQHLRKTPVHIAAEALKIPTYTPTSLRNADEQQKFKELNPDIAVVAAYGLILPAPILMTPKFGCLNIHASLLPRWRGAAPIQRAILSGDKASGITIMQMDEGLDTGEMLVQEKTKITLETTSQSLHDDLMHLGSKMIVRAVDDLIAGRIKGTPQPKDGITYAHKLTREDGRINWAKPAAEIERQIRSLQPWPGVFFLLENEPIKVLSAEIIANKSGTPGTLLDDSFTVACGENALQIKSLQRSGKNATDGASFLRGLRLKPGQTL